MTDEWYYENKWGVKHGPYRSEKEARSDILFDVEFDDVDYVLGNTKIWCIYTPTPAEEQFIQASFGVGGKCGCDGALDFGCPLCTEDWKTQFIERLRNLVKNYR